MVEPKTSSLRLETDYVDDAFGPERQRGGARRLRRLGQAPDLDPTEMAFSKSKAHLRKAAAHTIAGPRAESVAWRRLSRHENAGISCVTPDMFKHERNPLQATPKGAHQGRASLEILPIAAKPGHSPLVMRVRSARRG
jgi:hypothetical protein